MVAPGIINTRLFTERNRTPQQQEAAAQTVDGLKRIGTPEEVARGIHAFAQRHQADEVILSGMIHDHAARVRSQSMIAAASVVS